ncbi:MAG: helix-turn-helix transcriptional regulator [Cohaesibacteraceae bacterium]|nr:helix-turn-helix transcriptional regulator [Cohaesibacteraceae bacterium]
MAGIIKNEQTFGQRLKELRGLRSQQEMKNIMGVSVASLRNYEAGIRFPDANKLAPLAMELNADLNWLVTGEALQSGGVDYDEKIFKRVSRRVFQELIETKLISDMTAEELADTIILINKTVMSKLGPKPVLTEGDLAGLPGVIRFVTHRGK